MDLVISQYRTFILSLTFTTGLGNPFSLANGPGGQYTVGLMIKGIVPEADNLAIYSSETPTGSYALGPLNFIIPDTLTGTFPLTTSATYDVAVKSADGSIVATVLSGNVTISPSTRQAF